MSSVNIHESQHPSLQVKLSHLRDGRLRPKEVNKLVGEIASVIALEASAKVFACRQGDIEATSAAGGAYNLVETSPSDYVIVPVLRSGLAMVDAFLDMLPNPDAPVYHLGLYREKTTLSPVEYYNKLPVVDQPVSVAFVVDPVIATGGTAEAVISTLHEWKAKKVVFCSVIASKPGIERIAKEFSDVEFFVGKIDDELTSSGYILPGVGDVGDRLFHTIQ